MYFKNYKNLKIYERKLIQKERTNYIKLSTFNRNIYQSTYQTLLIVTTISTYIAQVSAFTERWFGRLQMISHASVFFGGKQESF